MSGLYLVVTEVYRPAPNARTSRSGWHETPGAWSVAEKVTIVDGSLKKQVLAEASIVIDIIHESMLKNRSGDKNSALVKHFLEKYQEDVKRATMLWSLKDPRNLAKLRELSDGNKTDTDRH